MNFDKSQKFWVTIESDWDEDVNTDVITEKDLPQNIKIDFAMNLHRDIAEDIDFDTWF